MRKRDEKGRELIIPITLVRIIASRAESQHICQLNAQNCAYLLRENLKRKWELSEREMEIVKKLGR